MKNTEERNILAVKDENLVNQSEIDGRIAPHPADYPRGFFKQRHIDGLIIATGDSSDLPDGTTHTKAYYELDTKKLKIWNSSTDDWDEVQFS